jgi:hypothetical protein
LTGAGQPAALGGLASREQWDAVQAKIKGRKVGAKPARSADYWLQPFLLCGTCLKPMRGRPRKGVPCYRCSTYAHAVVQGETRQCQCGNNEVRADQVEAFVLERLGKLRGELSRSDDRSKTLELYRLKGQQMDLLAETIRRGAAYYAETKPGCAPFGSRLADLLTLLPLDETVELCRQTAIGSCDGQKPETELETNEGGVPVRDVRDLVTEREPLKAGPARQALDQEQAAYDNLTRAKALAQVEREQQSGDRGPRFSEERHDKRGRHEHRHAGAGPFPAEGIRHGPRPVPALPVRRGGYPEKCQRKNP